MDGPASLFNPMGKMLVSITTDAYYNRYMLRSWDVVAFQRMVLLGYAIRRQRVANGAVPAFMKSHPEWATHPVDGREFLWDPDAHTLAVQELGEHRDNSTFTIPVWQSGM